MLTRKRQIAAKIEQNEGTAETLTAAEAGLLVTNPRVNVEPEFHDRNPARATLSNLAPIAGVRIARITFQLEMKGSGAAGTPPAFGPLLVACGLAQDIDTGVSVSYASASSNIPSLSMALYNDGIRHLIVGARGNVTFRVSAGGYMMMDFEFVGAYSSTTDTSMLSNVSYEDVIPASWKSASLTLDGDALVVNEVQFGTGNTLAVRRSANSASGLISTLITERNPTGRIDPEMTLVATHDFFGKLVSNAENELEFTVGSAAGNIATFTLPTIVYDSVSDDDRDSISVAGLGFRIVGDDSSSGDEDIQVVFT